MTSLICPVCQLYWIGTLHGAGIEMIYGRTDGCPRCVPVKLRFPTELSDSWRYIDDNDFTAYVMNVRMGVYAGSGDDNL